MGSMWMRLFAYIVQNESKRVHRICGGHRLHEDGSGDGRGSEGGGTGKRHQLHVAVGMVGFEGGVPCCAMRRACIRFAVTGGYTTRLILLPILVEAGFQSRQSMLIDIRRTTVVGISTMWERFLSCASSTSSINPSNTAIGILKLQNEKVSIVTAPSSLQPETTTNDA